MDPSEGVRVMTTWHGSPHTSTTQPLVLLALVIGGAFAALWGLFMVGELVSDPGGWYGLGLAALFVVPVLALGALALWRPAWAAPLLTVLVGLWVVAAVLSVVFADEWQAFEDTHGPISLILMLALSVPLLALGRTRSMLAGVLLLVATSVPLVTGVAWVAAGAGFGGTLVLLIMGMPFIAAGVLLVAVGVLDRRAATGSPPPV